MKLDIGCGRSPIPGCTTVDLFQRADICAPFWDIPLPDNSVDVIYSSYTLEHIEVFRAAETLREWKRILRPDGHMIIRVPDFLWVCRYFLGAPGPGWSMTLVFGPQNEWGELHKSGWTEQMMIDYCKEVGLIIARCEHIKEHEMEVLKFILTKTPLQESSLPELGAPSPKVTPRPADARAQRPWRTS